MFTKIIKSIFTLIMMSIFLSLNTSYAEIIDFETYGLNDGDPVGTIGLATFEANASIQGSWYAFVTTGWGNGTGTSFPFDEIGNKFITNPGGWQSDETIKHIRIVFAVPISNLSFYVADVDSGGATREQIKAEAFNQSGDPLGIIIHTSPINGGDGIVTLINFGSISGISQIDVTLNNIGTNPEATAIGFGLDNIGFEYASTSIEDLLALFDFWLSNGSIEGSGPGNSASGRLNAFRNLLEMAGDLMGTGDVDGACGQLMTAYNKCDDDSPPPDFLAGNSVSELSNQILVLMEALGCE